MKIMIVTPYFYPKIGGLEGYALNVANGLLNEGNDVVVVTANHTAKKRSSEMHNGIRIIRLPMLFKFSNTPINPFWYFSLRKIIKDEKPDIINAHSPVPFMADMAYYANNTSKFVITYHAGSMKKGGGPIDLILGLYEKIFLKRLLLHADEVISVYPKFVRHLTNDLREVHFLPPAVDIDIFKPSNHKKADKQEVIYVGRIERSSSWKGIMTLINAMRRVVEENPQAILKLVGDGDATNDYKAAVKKLGLEKNVKFTGPLYGKKLINEYCEANVLVLPSETEAESFGTVLIEAMACGIPVIGSNVGGIPNVIQNNQVGLLVPPNSEVEFAESINKLLGDAKLSLKIGKSARTYVKDNFSITRLVKSTNALFLDLYAK